jgi:hypothetical protein
MTADNSRPPQSEKDACARIAAGFDVAAHASVTGGEVREDYQMTAEDRAAFKASLRRNWRLFGTSPVRGVLCSRTMDEAAAWRDGWRAAMACAVLVAETARAPAAVVLLREQLEPPA